MPCTVRLTWTAGMTGKAVGLQKAAVIEKRGLTILTKMVHRVRERNELATQDGTEKICTEKILTMIPQFRFQSKRPSSL
jgi:hypothetical protein